MPYAKTEAMRAHLAEISAAVDPGAHAVLMLDQAGWHSSTGLAVAENVTPLPLAPRSPELNPVENIWQYRRENWPLEPRLRGLRRHCRPLRRPPLRRLEQARRPAGEHHIHRSPRLGPWVLINERWYKPADVDQVDAELGPQLRHERRDLAELHPCGVAGREDDRTI